MTLTEFLAARLDEDEAAARAVLDNKAYFRQIEWGWFDADFGDFHPAEYGKSGVGLPARVLREVEAKRAILGTHVGFERTADRPTAHLSIQAANVAHRAVQRLAAVYADHPDYDEAWRP